MLQAGSLKIANRYGCFAFVDRNDKEVVPRQPLASNLAILYSLPLSSYVEVRLEPLPGSGKEPAGIRMTQKNGAITTTLTTVVPGTPPDPPLKDGEEVVHFKMFYELNGVAPSEQVRLIYHPVPGAVGRPARPGSVCPPARFFR